MAHSTARGTANQTAVRTTSEALQLTLALLIGLSIFAGVAFAHPQIVHNAAHDSRHAVSVPCH